MIKTNLIPIYIAACIVGSSTYAGFLNRQALMENAASVAERSIRKYSPLEHFILNLGLTTAPIDAAMRARIPDPADQAVYFSGVACEQIIQIKDLAPEEQDRVLDRIIPASTEISGRTLVIQRVLHEGRSMQELIPILVRFMKERRPRSSLSFSFIINRKMLQKDLQDTAASSVEGGGYVPKISYVIAPDLTKTIIQGRKPIEFAYFKPFYIHRAFEPSFHFENNPAYEPTGRALQSIFSQRVYKPISYARYGRTLNDDLQAARDFIATERKRQEDIERRERIVENDVILAAFDHAGYIMNEFPPDKFFIINFGVPATLTSAAFRALIPDEAAREKYYAELTVEGIKHIDSLSRAEKHEFFRRILPSPESLHGKKMVLHRTSWLGHSSSRLIPEIANYLREVRGGEQAAYYYVFFNKKGESRVDELINENEDIFFDGVFSRDRLYAETINMGLKLTDYAENLPVSVDQVMALPNFRFVRNTEAARLDARFQEVLSAGGSVINTVKAIAVSCAEVLANPSKPAKRRTSRKKTSA